MNAQNTAEVWRPQGDSNPCYRRERATYLFVLSCILISLLTICGQPVHASESSAHYERGTIPAKTSTYEVRLGYGKNCGTLYGDGSWVQNDLPGQMEKCRDAFSVTYIGDTYLSWLKWTVGLAFRRGPVASGEFVDDECHASKQYSGGPIVIVAGLVPMGQCDRRYVAKKVETKIYALPITLQPTLQLSKDVSLFVGFGGSIYFAYQDIEWSNDTSVPNNVCAINGCEDGRYRRAGFSPYFEIGGSYRGVGLTLYYAHAERPREAMQHGVYGALLTKNF